MAAAEEESEQNAPGSDPVVRWIDEFLRLDDGGETPAVAEFLRRVPDEHRQAVGEVLEEIMRAPARHRTSDVDVDALIGTRLGDFEVLARIGRGGMGQVYLAHQQSLDRQVALKVLAPGIVDSDRALRRFRLEARVAARLRHPNLVRVHQVGQENGLDFLVMDFVDGASLHELLYGGADLPEAMHALRFDAPSSAADLHRVALVIAEVASALQHVHAHGIIHRDIKPQNILIDRQGRAYVTDFGLAKDVREASISRQGDLAGTYFYMSPEQAHAKVVPVDHRTDIFSLGVVLYEMIARQRPFAGRTSRQVLYAISFREPPPLRRLNAHAPKALATICGKALEKKPHDRYPTASAMAEDLQRFAAGEEIDARPPSVARRARRTLVRFRFAAALAAVVLIAAAATAVAVQARMQAAKGRLSLVSEGGDARVLAFAVDERTGALAPAGELGRVSNTAELFYLPRGHYRVVCVGDQGFAELSCDLTGDEPVAAQAWIRPTADVVAGMIAIEGGEFVFGCDNPAEPDWFYRSRRQSVAPFYIDAREVTNGEYRRFCADSGYPLPEQLRDPGYSSEWDELPVVSLRWESARRYAEWAGKRLPTVYEWQLAARGRDGAELPAGITREAAEVRAVLGRVDDEWLAVSQQGRQAMYTYAMTRVSKASEAGADRSPFGLVHVLGNVREWTESRWVVQPATGSPAPVVSGENRVLVGAGWGTFADEDIARLGWVSQLVQRSGSFEVGFRCAKSVRSE